MILAFTAKFIVPYLSILKLVSYTRSGLNIRWVVQQNEWNKRLQLGPFKCWVPKLLNLMNAKIVPYIMEN